MPETPHYMVRPARWRTDEAGIARVRRQGYSGVRLSAQTHAVPFYARYGFQPEGEIYQDAGIPHLAMTFTFKDNG